MFPGPVIRGEGQKNKRDIDEKLGIIESNDCDKQGIDKKAGWWSDDKVLSKQEAELLKGGNIFTRNREDRQKKKYYAIDIDVKEINYPDVDVDINLYEYKREQGKPGIDLISERPFDFTVSFFDTPYGQHPHLRRREVCDCIKGGLR